MYTNKELEEIYDERYSEKESAVNAREVVLYNKLRGLLLPKDFLEKRVSNLDLGCGRGHKTVGFAKNFSRVLAVDLSQNVIDHCLRFYQNEQNIEFKAMDATKIEERFNLITAFGFSLFNTADNQLFLKNVGEFGDRNLMTDQESYMIIGSFTDFSGTGSDSWYMHTSADLKYLTNVLKEKGADVQIVFPHKKAGNYFGSGFYNFAAEMTKLLVKKRRTFFIVIKHG